VNHKKNNMMLTKRSDMGVLSMAGRCCSRASTMQLAMMVVRIRYSNGVDKSRKNCGTTNNASQDNDKSKTFWGGRII